MKSAPQQQTSCVDVGEHKHNYSALFILGISGKSQILFAVVYLSRYLDLFTTFISVYNTFMKFIFVVSSLGTLYLMYMKFRATYDHNHDSFRIEFLLIPCVVLALLINHDFTVLEVSWIRMPRWIQSWFTCCCRFRYYGHSQSTWSRLQSYHNCSWSVRQARLKVLRAITCLHSARTEPFTSSIG